MIYSFAIIAVLIAGFAYLVWRMQKKKASDTRSHHIVLLDGFPIVHIPISLPRDDAESIARNLQTTYNAAWDKMSTVYGVEPRPAQIAVIGSSLFSVDPDHPHVLWIAPRDKVFLRVQPSMFYWFMRELHNIFRYQLFGMEWIYKAKDGVDKANIVAVERWIEDSFSEA